MEQTPSTYAGAPRISLVSLFLVAVMISTLLAPLSSQPSGSELLLEQPRYNSDDWDDSSMKLYNIFLGKRNSTAGGDGYLTTKTPDDGQINESALENSLEFRTRNVLSDMPMGGQPATGGGWKVPLNIFLRATAGTDQNTATYTFTLRIEDDGGSSETVATEQKELGACDSLFGCGWNEVIVNLQWIGDQYKSIPSGGALTLTVSAESTCEGQSGGPFGPSCDAEVMWGEPGDFPDDYSVMSIKSNAASGSEVRIFSEGALWTDTETLDWYPNELPEERSMAFKVNVVNALGREDVTAVSVQLRAPDGSYPVDHTFTNAELTESAGVLSGAYVWTYPAGIQAGVYALTLSVSDIQGSNPFVFEHDDVEVHQYGVSVRNAADRSAEYIAPGQTTPIQFILRHTGSSGSSLDIQLDVQTTLDSSWSALFDRPEGYTIGDGGNEVTAQLTLAAPTELGNAPPRLDISVRAYSTNGSEVYYTMMQIILEKLDVFAPPMVALWDSEHEDQIDNSTLRGGQLEFDVTAPQFVDDLGPPTPFYIEIFNTGFDVDSFRFEVTEKPRGTVFYFVDNQTGQMITQDPNDGLWHSPSMPRHTNYTIALFVNPSSEPDDPDFGLMEIELSSAGNTSLSAVVGFTPHRTNGLQASVVFDCDGESNGLGHVEYQNCLNDDSDEYIDVRMRIEATQTSGDDNQVIDWRVVNPATYERNEDGEHGKYTLWDYFITNLDNDPMPVMQMTVGDSVEFNLEIHLTNQVLAANHTIYVRIEEVTENNDAQRFFDLPISIEVGDGDPDLKIIQNTTNQALAPGVEKTYEMTLKNEGNTDMQVVLSATAPSGWEVVAENHNTQSSLVLVDAFSEITFQVTITAAENARHGDFHTIVVTGKPQSFETGFSDQFNAELDIDIRVEINDPAVRITNELGNMRNSTIMMLAGFIILVVAAIAGKRRRVDVWDEEENEYDVDEEFDLPEAVTDEESELEEITVDEDDDLDEIELIDD